MSKDGTSLWPEDIIASVPPTPLSVLREQASHLGKLTNNIVQARVDAWTDEEGDFCLGFKLVAPSLGNYEYNLFLLYHGLELYPVKVSGADIFLKDEDQLRQFLRTKFASSQSKNMVRALVAQARESKPSRPDAKQFDDDIPF